MDETNNIILDSIENIKTYVEKRFKEQKEELEATGEKPCIDLSNSKLSCLYFQDSKVNTNKFFNLIDLSGEIPGFENIEDEYEPYKAIVSENIKINHSIMGRATFHHIRFKGKVEVKGSNFADKCSFKNCLFEDDVCFNNSIFSKNIEIDSCTFKGRCELKGTQISISNSCITNCTFERCVDMSQICFMVHKTNYQKATFEIEKCKIFGPFCLDESTNQYVNIRFNHLTIEDGVSMKKLRWNTMAFIIHDSKINGTSIINFDEKRKNKIDNIGLWNCYLYGHLHIEDLLTDTTIIEFCHLFPSSMLRFDEMSSSDMDFMNNTIEGRITLQECKIKKANFAHTICQGTIDCFGTIFETLEDEYSAMLLRKQCEAIGVDSLASTYYKMQMNIRRKVKDLKISDKILLWFKGFSNDYSNNWVRPLYIVLIWTFAILHLINLSNGCCFFEYSLSLKEFDNAFKAYLNILNIFNIIQSGLNYAENVDLNSFGSFLMLIAKVGNMIFIYQMKPAFKKWDKI